MLWCFSLITKWTNILNVKSVKMLVSICFFYFLSLVFATDLIIPMSKICRKQRTKLSTKFNIKDQTKFQHKNNIVYYGKCPNRNCKINYVAETDRRSTEIIIDHNKRNKNHTFETCTWWKSYPRVGRRFKNSW